MIVVVVAIIPAVVVAILISVAAIVAVASVSVTIAITRLVADVLLETRDAHFDVTAFVTVEAVVRSLAKQAFDHIGFVTQTIGFAVRQDITPIELVDALLELVDPGGEITGLIFDRYPLNHGR